MSDEPLAYGELTPMEKPTAAPINLFNGSPGALADLETTLNLSVASDMKLLLRSEISTGVGIHDAKVTEVNAVAIVQRPFDAVDKKTAEVTSKWHTRFIDESGRSYWSNSSIVGRIAGLVLAFNRGKGRFSPPIPFYFKHDKTSGGGNITLCTVNDADLDRLLAGQG